MTHDGKEVRTRLEAAPLRDVAETTRGVYFPAQTQILPLGQVYLSAIAGQARCEETDDALPVYGQHYLWFLAAGFVLMTLAAVDRRPSSRRRPARRNRRAVYFHHDREDAMKTRLLGIACILLAGMSISAESPADWQTLLRQGDAAYAHGDFTSGGGVV